MGPGIFPVPAILAALLEAPLPAFMAEDALLVAMLVGLGAAVGMVVGAGTTRVVRHRRRSAASPDDGGPRRPIRRPGVELTEDPIVVALGVGGDEATRARRRRRPIGTGLHTPPGESPPPT
jgi:hypothetical protein